MKATVKTSFRIPAEGATQECNHCGAKADASWTSWQCCAYPFGSCDGHMQPLGIEIPVGQECVLLLEKLVYKIRVVDSEGSVHEVEVDAEHIKVPCEVPDCTAESAYDSPRHWCSPHWREWMDCSYAPEDEPAWMKLGDEDEEQTP